MSGDVVNVKVVVYENDDKVQVLSVAYFHGQPYAVFIDTPDGVDRRFESVTNAFASKRAGVEQ